MGSSPATALIDILNDDALLHVFYLYRPFLLGEDKGGNTHLRGGETWVRGRWWYKLAQVCQRWRNLIFGSASYLGLALVCARGTPITDMLAHSPPLPLVVDFFDDNFDITAEDEEGVILALNQRDRVHRVRLCILASSLQKIIVAMDEEYPILEYLILMPLKEDTSSILILPETLQAPHLRHLSLVGFALPIGSRLLTTVVGVVTLFLRMKHPSTYFHPNAFLHWLSFMPQLETLVVLFSLAAPILPNHEIENQPMHTSIITPVTLPNLCYFRFGGVSTDLEALIHRIITPRLEKLQIDFYNQPFSLPHLQQLLNTTENLSFDSAEFCFHDEEASVRVYSRETEMYTLSMNVFSWHLDWQVSSVALISQSLSQVFSAVERLTLGHRLHRFSFGEHNEVDRAEWRKLLNPFRNMKTLRIDNGLVEQISRCLESEDGEPSLELLPELQELTYPGSGDSRDAFTSFIKARQDAGRPVTLVPGPDDTSLVSHAQVSPVITSGSSEAGSDLDIEGNSHTRTTEPHSANDAPQLLSQQ